MQAVRFDRYGGVDVLEVRDVHDPVPEAGQVLVAVRAAGTNPGEITIREGGLHEMFPATFPSGEGTDFAGVVRATGEGVTTLSAGDEVLGWTDERASHAELVAVPARQVIPKPPQVPWEVAGSLYVAGMAAYASVRAVALAPGETVAVSAAAGGVGSLAVQLARRSGARVIGLAGTTNHDWLREHGIVPVAYGEGQAQRLAAAAPDGLDAFIDTFGRGYVELALELGVDAGRINTIADFAAIERFGVHAEGTQAGSSPDVLAELARLVADGELEVPIAATFPLSDVRAAYTQLAERHTRGKIVLIP